MLRKQRRMDRCAVLMQDSIVFPRLRPLPVLPKLENTCNSLNLLNPFSQHDAVDAKEDNSLNLNLGFDCPAFFILADEGVFQYMFCRFVITSCWNI